MSRFQPRLTDRETLTEQEILDAVREHAAQMPGKCTQFNGDNGGCLYRSPDGTNACFVGAFLTDEEAKGLDDEDEDGDGLTAKNLTEKGLMPARLVPHTELLSELQLVHDFSSREDWQASISAIAANRGLN